MLANKNLVKKMPIYQLQEIAAPTISIAKLPEIIINDIVFHNIQRVETIEYRTIETIHENKPKHVFLPVYDPKYKYIPDENIKTLEVDKFVFKPSRPVQYGIIERTEILPEIVQEKTVPMDVISSKHYIRGIGFVDDDDEEIKSDFGIETGNYDNERILTVPETISGPELKISEKQVIYINETIYGSDGKITKIKVPLEMPNKTLIRNKEDYVSDEFDL
jgi:hypothetical protein